MKQRNCEYCNKLFKGNAKKRYCSDSCRVYAHRESKWKRMSDLTPEEWEKVKVLWNQK